jgi:hypothetical protein
METAAEKKTLPADVAEKFSLAKGHGVGEYRWNGNIIHLDRISPERATQLVDQGFPYLVAKEAPVSKEKTKAALPEAPKQA